MHQVIWIIKDLKLWAEKCHILGLKNRLYNLILFVSLETAPLPALNKMDEI